jgi:hypothetical protein
MKAIINKSYEITLNFDENQYRLFKSIFQQIESKSKGEYVTFSCQEVDFANEILEDLE